MYTVKNHKLYHKRYKSLYTATAYCIQFYADVLWQQNKWLSTNNLMQTFHLQLSLPHDILTLCSVWLHV